MFLSHDTCVFNTSHAQSVANALLQRRLSCTTRNVGSVPVDGGVVMCYVNSGRNHKKNCALSIAFSTACRNVF